MTTPLRGFLVVLPRAPDRAYAGVDRVPAYEVGDPDPAMNEYVFGQVKDEDTNLIPSLGAARRLQRMFADAGRDVEIVYCCEGPDSPALDGLEGEGLGYDIAGVRGDRWSIVEDFCTSEWANTFRGALNRFGLFAARQTAEKYLAEYRAHDEADADCPFDIVYLVRVDD